MPRHSTPSQNFNGVAETLTIPSKAASHGAPARRYLNEKVTGVLVEGLKRLVTLK
jgi:COMPASS component SDC1